MLRKLKIEHKISRRRFLREGFLWGCTAVAFSLLGRTIVPASSPAIRPVKARHYRHLAG